MKILYALQSTGNGHIARAQEIIPILQKYAEVDVLTSGHQSQIKLPIKIKYKLSGISLIYNKKGGLSYRKILFKNNFWNALKWMFKVPIKEYDLILNDFEPITAWACKLRGKTSVQISHQCALLYRETPKPEKKDLLGEAVVKYYAPAKQILGFHFQQYHPDIQPPVIRKKIRTLTPTDHGHYLVYLPSFVDEVLIKELQQIPVKWKVFSKYAKTQKVDNNIEINPIDEQLFLTYFESCTGILCNAGFETPSEALFLGKKLYVIPIKKQYEQACNAFALAQMGIPTSATLEIPKIKNWVMNGKIQILDIPDNLEGILTTRILKT